MSDTTLKSGQWIWLEPAARPNTWMRFRRRFTIDVVPTQAVVRIAVDSKYWLWLNGTLVVREGGLKRGPTEHGTYFDEVDLGPHLVAGENVIAVLAWYWGVDGSSHCSSGRGGLLVDGVLSTDDQWRASPDPAFLESELALFSGKTVLSEWSVHYDASRAEDNWIEPAFDDTSWPTAQVLAEAGAGPWGTLVRRPIPFWDDSALLDYKAVNELTGGVLRATLPANLQVYPAMTIIAPTGLTVLIKGERDWNTTRYVTRDGEQTFEVPAWGNGHHVDYTMPKGVHVVRLMHRRTGYATTIAGAFESDVPRLETLWKKSVRSTLVNLRDSYMDCPDRERSQWPGDAVAMIDQGLYSLDRRVDALSAKFFSEWAGWRTSDGILWGAVPSGRFRGTFREFPGQSLAGIGVAAANYFMHAGDLAMAGSFLPAAREYLLRHYTVHPTELVAHRGPWNVGWSAGTQAWYDWGDNQDWRLLDTTLYDLALAAVELLATHTGDTQDLAEVQSRRGQIRERFDAVFWTGNAYRSPGHAGPPDDRGNALAVYGGLADRSHWPALQQVLMHSRESSIYFERFPLEALCLMNAPELAIERMLARYAIDSAYTTLPERWGEESNHGWGGGPIVVMGRHLAGIDPLSPGFRTYRIRPQLGPLRSLRVTVPSVLGNISVALTRDDHTTQIKLDLPPGGECSLELLHHGTQTLDVLPLRPGRHQLSFATGQ